MIVNLNFALEAWIKQLWIEAESEEDAKRKLSEMTLDEILNEATCVVAHDMKFNDIETSIISYDLEVKVTDIEFYLDPEEMDESVIKYLKGILPKERTFTLNGVTDRDDLNELVGDELLVETSYEAKSFKIEILKKK